MKDHTAMNAHVEVRIPIVVFKDEEDGIWYAHCPVLDITGYGKSENEAEESFNIVLHETIDYMVTHGTLDKELRKLGWRKMQGRPTPPRMETLLRKNGDLRRMMALPHSFTYGSVSAIA